MDGPWQVGHKSADAYGALAAETAKAMRQVDPSIKLVACGSSNDRMPTFGSWEATVLDHTFDHVDYISLHAYFEKHGDDRASFLASGLAMDRFIEGVVATADHVAAKKHSRKRLQLSFDEWNIWYESRFAGHTNLEWAQAPRLIEDEYTVEDAVVVGSLLMSLLRHADRVGVACLAQLVNIIAPIRAESDRPAWRQTIFHPFALTARYARGTVLRVEPRTPTYDTQRHGDVPTADVVATHDPQTGQVCLFALNRSETDPVTLTAHLRALPGLRVVEHLVLGGRPDELLHTNTADDPDRVQPRTSTDNTLTDGELTATLPPVSWTMLRLAPAA
jgi:alpha-N-arabinofuranosidase